MARWYITVADSEMKKSLMLIPALALTALLSCSKYSGDPVTESFNVEGNYSRLCVEDAFNVHVSDTASLVYVTVGENIMPEVVVKQEDGKLTIRLKRSLHFHTGEMNVIMPRNQALTSVRLSGASEYHTPFVVTGQKVELDLSGASDFVGDVEAETVVMDLSGASSVKSDVSASSLDLDMSGASDAFLAGTTGLLKLDLSGASTLKKRVVGGKYALSCERCEGSLSGASDAFIHCEGSIEVDLSGASDLRYTGDANTTGSRTSGSSHLVHDEL